MKQDAGMTEKYNSGTEKLWMENTCFSIIAITVENNNVSIIKEEGTNEKRNHKYSA